MKIKVCGMREPDNIRAVEQLGIDYMGFIFWPHSPRFVSAPPAYLPAAARRVGVFVDASAGDIVHHVAQYRLTDIQLHGHESPEFIARLREALVREQVGPCAVIKSLPVGSAHDLDATAAYASSVDAFLFDTRSQLPGGSGRQFDWSLLNAYGSDTPFLLSGGIGPDHVPQLLQFFGSCDAAVRCIGIDLNSRFENAPGLKDIGLLHTFIQHFRQGLDQTTQTR